MSESTLADLLRDDAASMRFDGNETVANNIDAAIARIEVLERALLRLRHYFDYPLNGRREFVRRIDATLTGDYSKSQPIHDDPVCTCNTLTRFGCEMHR